MGPGPLVPHVFHQQKRRLNSASSSPSPLSICQQAWAAARRRTKPPGLYLGEVPAAWTKRRRKVGALRPQRRQRAAPAWPCHPSPRPSRAASTRGAGSDGVETPSSSSHDNLASLG